jgi:hypothetical protein
LTGEEGQQTDGRLIQKEEQIFPPIDTAAKSNMMDQVNDVIH